MKHLLLLFLSLISIQAVAQKQPLTFSLQNIPSSSTFRAIHVLNDSSVWIAGTKGNYVYTNNGGDNWHQGVVPDAEKLDFRDLHVFNKKHVALMSCGNGASSRIYITKDMGSSWSMTYQNQHEKAFFNGIDFWNDQEGMLTSDAIDKKPYILTTKNGGESWTRLVPNQIPDLKEGEYAFAASGTGIVARGASEVWIATGGIHSRIFYSQDKGKNWDVYHTPIIQGTSTEGIYSFFINQENKAVAVGGNYKQIEESKGNVILSTDSGKTWRLAQGAKDLAFKECVLQLQKEVWLATGPSGTALSLDDGETWTEVDNRPFHTMDYHPESRTGFLAGDNGLVVKFHWNGK